MVKLTWRIWLLLAFMLFSIVAIFNFPPMFMKEGVVVKSVELNSSAFNSGIIQGEIIEGINGKEISNFQDYLKEIEYLKNVTNDSVKIVINTNKNTYPIFTDSNLGLIVSNIPSTNLKLGLDLAGGARAVVKPDQKISASEMQDLIAISNERFNIYGIQDVQIRSVSDLSGNNFMLIEIAGATPRDLNNLISQQGKFEAKIGNETVFVGGNKDITYVCRDDASCALVTNCQQSVEGWFCSYEFVIDLSSEAAKRHADITNKLGNDPTNPGYLDKKIDFYVDGVNTTSLFISQNLKGQQTTKIQIQGSGSGVDRSSALEDAENSMKQMQTILLTGSLPYKLEIVKIDTISPELGNRFVYTILITGIASMLLVSLIVFIRYRNLKSSLAIILTSFSEVLIILGVASIIKWNLDLPSIVGILITIGTGVDMQIIIIDEARSKRFATIREKIKSALFIVFSSFFTALVSLLPLFWVGVGLFRGFALTTIIGITVGVLITRPAFADIIKMINKD